MKKAKLIFECACGNNVVAEARDGSNSIRFPDDTTFGGDDSGSVYLDCGECGKSVEVAGF